MSSIYRDIQTCVQSGEPVLLFTLLSGPPPYALGSQFALSARGLVAQQGFPGGLPAELLAWAMEMAPRLWREGSPCTLSWERAGEATLRFFVEAFGRPPKLLIVGAGHIAQPLAVLGALLDFEVHVYDDRAAYATRARFPHAAVVTVAPFSQLLAHETIDERTWVVIVTRGHRHDAAVLEQVFDSPAPYIGMIGSRRRVRTVLDDMLARGYRAELLQRLYAPIGLDIGAQTPSEIAVAIAAEWINLRRGGRAPSLRLAPRLLAASASLSPTRREAAALTDLNLPSAGEGRTARGEES